MAEQFHSKVFKRMLADEQRYLALSLLYAAHLRNPEKVRSGQLNRRRFLRVASAALVLPYLAMVRAKERVQKPPPLPKNEAVERAVLSHISLSFAHLARNAAEWQLFLSAAGALERMKAKPLFTNLPQTIQERLLPDAELVSPSFKSGSFAAWSKNPGSFAANAIGTAPGSLPLYTLSPLFQECQEPAWNCQVLLRLQLARKRPLTQNALRNSIAFSAKKGSTQS